MIEIRLAHKEDVQGIMIVENTQFGNMEVGGIASEETMRHRLELLNEHGSGWFWVAVDKDEVLGYVIIHPVNYTPGECHSWAFATDGGTLNRTYCDSGKNVFIVSMAVLPHAPPGVASLLVNRLLVKWLVSGKEQLMFCSRLPSFADAHADTGVTPEEYCQMRNEDGSPVDWMLRLYWEMAGRRMSMRLIKDGFPPDKESGGHGVLCVVDDPVAALTATAILIYKAGTQMVSQAV